MKIKREPLGGSRYRYTYVPRRSGEHVIDVQYNYHRVPGNVLYWYCTGIALVSHWYCIDILPHRCVVDDWRDLRSAFVECLMR